MRLESALELPTLTLGSIKKDDRLNQEVALGQDDNYTVDACCG